MTGYGKEVFSQGSSSYLIEIHSVNKKNLDLSLYIPKDLLFLDLEIRKRLASVIKRGQVTFKLTKESEESELAYPVDVLCLKKTKKALENISEELGYQSDSIPFIFLIEQYEKGSKLTKKYDEGFEKLFFDAVDAALIKFNESRNQEGRHLVSALFEHLAKIRFFVTDVQQLSKGIEKDYRQKLEAKLAEMVTASFDIQERLSKEVVFYVDKIDVSEEIQRLTSHLDAFEQTLKKEEAPGKKLEFLLLEMQRESHTLTAKSQLLDLINIGLAIKSEIEKIREQLQNLE